MEFNTAQPTKKVSNQQIRILQLQKSEAPNQTENVTTDVG
jgi:hypothetical protein